MNTHSSLGVLALLSIVACSQPVDSEEVGSLESAAACRKCGKPALAATTYWVDSSPALRSTPDGTKKNPFRTLQQALAQAELDQPASVEIEVSRGDYSGDLVIARPTVIRGAKGGTFLRGGGIRNDSQLRLEHMTLTDPPGGGVDAVQGGDTWVTTSLSDVLIVRPSGFGVRQIGGRLDLTDVAVSGVNNVRDRSQSGTAVEVRGGARADATNLRLEGNARALLVDGASTVFSSPAGLSVRATSGELRVSSSLSDTFGDGWVTEVPAAVDVRGGAHFQADGYEILDSVGLAFHARSGSTALLRSGRLLRATDATSLFEPPPPAPGTPPPGWVWALVIVDTGATAQIAGKPHSADQAVVRAIGPDAVPPGAVDIGYALAGAIVGSGSRLTLSDALVHDTNVGITIQGTPSQPLECLMTNVWLRRNGANLEAQTLPLPPLPGEAPPPPPVCATVAWR